MTLKSDIQVCGQLSLITLLLVISSLSYCDGILYPYEPRNPLGGVKSQPGTPWPMPLTLIKGSNLVSISAFQFVTNIGAKCDPLDFATNHYQNYTFNFVPDETLDTNYSILTHVHVHILRGMDENGCNDFPVLSDDPYYEAYNISIRVRSDDGLAYAEITALTVWGAIRGIDTFSQLIWDNGKDIEQLHYYINVTEISDAPRFPHRGLMVDTARHYIPEETLLTLLDAMMYNKFNVFHWHIVDDQSFPYVSKKFPELSQKGAYKKGQLVYTPDMVQNLLNQARVRGIRVILEFDTPGHTHGFGKSHPELLTPCYGRGIPETPNYPHHAARENFDPTNPEVYTFMREFFTEVVQNVSKDVHIHLGMDEVYPPCWESSPKILDFMLEKNFSRISQVQEYYTQRHVEMIKSLGAVPISWQDPLDAGVSLDKDVIIQAWKDWGQPWPEQLQNFLDLGHRVLLSSCWYINYINYGESWRNYYNCDPILDLPFITEEQKKLVLGGEAAIWAEFVDRTNLLPRLFPFASAVAEKLWSKPEVSSVNDAMWRLDQHRCRLLRRNIPAQPILNGYCENAGVF